MFIMMCDHSFSQSVLRVQAKLLEDHHQQMVKL